MKQYFSLVKFSHTIFAMPFALIGAMLGWVTRSASSPLSALETARLFGLVVGCMVFARSAAMAFNRYLDRDIDAKNERTRSREIPAGIVPAGNALAFTLICCGLFVVCCLFINPLCLMLSPVALAVVLGYSYTKRFTALCHLVLGLGLALAPVGAYVALTGVFALAPVVLGVAVLTWVSGFDIIYALQDEVFDRENGLNSIPALLGKSRALGVSSLLHLVSGISIALFGWLLATCQQHGPLALGLIWVGAVFFWGMLFYQHRLVKPNDLSRVNAAFFTANGIASVVFAVAIIAGLLAGAA